MVKQVSVQQYLLLKTQKCTSISCCTFNNILNPIREKNYKPTYLTQKYSLHCQNYHTDHDYRRPLVNPLSSLQYSSLYIIDQSLIKQQCLKSSKDCRNYVEYAFHPLNYKLIKCKNQEEGRQCQVLYCTGLHSNQIINDKLLEYLTKIRQNYTRNKNTITSISTKFQHKNTHILKLRNYHGVQSRNYHGVQNRNINEPYKDALNKQDIEEIKKIKQRIKSKGSLFLKMEQQKYYQQVSRFTHPSVNPSTDPNIIFQPIRSQQPLHSTFNYFNYGQLIPMVQGRQIQFKHFKDISEPEHIPLIMRYIVAFLNCQGGKLYIGIDDNCYVYGTKFKQSQYDKLLLNIDREGKFGVTPPLMPQKYQIRRIPVVHQKKGQQRWVIQITVFPNTQQNNKKLFLYQRECYMRMNASTHKLNASDLIEFFSQNPNFQGLEEFSQRNNQTVQDSRKHQETVKSANEKILSLDKTRNNYQNERQNKLMEKETKKQPNYPNIELQNWQSKSLSELSLIKSSLQQQLSKLSQILQQKNRQLR